MVVNNVVIVGAGAAGIAAATRLLSRGFNNLMVLEAESRIGGRVHSTRFADQVVDMGAQYCHGEKGNAVYEMAHPLGLLESTGSFYSNVHFADSRGNQLDREITDKLMLLCQSLVEKAGEGLGDYKGSLGDFVCSEYKRYFETNPAFKVDPVFAKEFLEWFHLFENSIEGSPSWFETSGPGLAEYWECEGDPVLTWKDGGYRNVFDLLMCKYPDASKLLPLEDKIQLNKEVSRIEWNDEHHNSPVKVHCSDGTQINTDCVILTVSLGVLKDRSSALFSPELPLRKQNSISGLSINAVDKIWVKFPYMWWPEETTVLCLMWTEEDKQYFSAKDGLNRKRAWMQEVFAFSVNKCKSGLLCGWIVGPAAQLMEKCSHLEVLNGCQELFHRFFGKTFKIPHIEKIMRSEWHSNPHFRGSYSFRSVVSDRVGAYASHLAEPLTNKNGQQVVLFAGEATHDHYYSTVHGAIESGWREADRILRNSRSMKSAL